MYARQIVGIALILLAFAGISAAQPANDSCMSPLPVNGVGTFLFENSLTSTDGPGDVSCAEQLPNDAPHVANDVWFCWTAACNGMVTVDTCGYTTVDTKVAVYAGCECPTDATNLLTCDNDSCGFQSKATFEAKAGVPYLIQLGTATTVGGGEGKFRITCGEIHDPACAASGLECVERDQWNALLSELGDAHTAEDFTPSQDGVITGLCWWGTYVDGGSECPWLGFDFLEVTYFNDVNGLPGSVHAGAFASWAGNLDLQGPTRTFQTLMGDVTEYEYHATHAPVSVNANQCYWVHIKNRHSDDCRWYWATARSGNQRAIVDGGGNSNVDGFDDGDLVAIDPAVCLNIVTDEAATCEDAPINDLCLNAVSVGNEEIVFDTSAATTDGAEHDDCLFPVGDDQIHRDIWFTYQATCTGTLRVETCGSQFDTRLALYSGTGCLSRAALLTCNDDQCGVNLPVQSMLDWEVNAGSFYKIRVGGYDGTGGPGRLLISCTNPPPNDLCEESIVQTLPFTVMGDNSAATNECMEFNGSDVWVAFVVPEMSSVTIEYNGEHDVFMDAAGALATSCDCASFVEAQLVESIENGIRLTWHCLAPGLYYYPVVADPANEGSYTINATSATCVQPCAMSTADCCAPHLGAGCGDSTCCELICENDAYCCLFEWDELCAIRASAACLICPTSPCLTATAGCLHDHMQPGCYDPEICQAVCACQYQCCTQGWDETCLISGQSDGCAASDYFCTSPQFPCGDFDFDCNNVINLSDFRVFAHCLYGPCQGLECSELVLDSDFCCGSAKGFGSGEVDMRDFHWFLNEYDQP